jgi:16S rRNA processing protein RimM
MARDWWFCWMAFADRTAAEALKGFLVGAPRAALPKTEEDEFYWADLVGLEVVNAADERLGKVAGLIETGANAVLRVLAMMAPNACCRLFRRWCWRSRRKRD